VTGIDGLLAFGWRSAQTTLAEADSERRLVTHWFRTGVDDSVNSDDHFGSNERTLRFLGVALPTLINQLGATAAAVALPWDVSEGSAPSLTVVVLRAATNPAFETRGLTRLTAGPGPGPPYWRLETDRINSPAQLAATATGLSIPG
jgi:hypothetical protein